MGIIHEHSKSIRPEVWKGSCGYYEVVPAKKIEKNHDHIYDFG